MLREGGPLHRRFVRARAQFLAPDLRYHIHTNGGRMQRSAFVYLFVFSLAGRALYAQGTGTIHGSVTDPATAAVTNAKVTAILEERGTTRGVSTDSQGNYVFPLLPVGTYTVKVEVSGFKSFVQSGIDLSTNDNARVDAQLELGNTTQSVSVTAEAPMVDSRSSVVGTLIDGRRWWTCPPMAATSSRWPGCCPAWRRSARRKPSPATAAVPRVSVSGSRGNQNLFLFDGAQFNAVFRNTGLELSAAGRATGGQGADQQLQRRIRAQRGRGVQRGDEIRHEPDCTAALGSSCATRS